jgi:hypothetical protein
MSNHAKRKQGQFIGGKPTTPPYRATITLGLLPTGQVQVTGPLHLRNLCEQMLDEAYNVLKQYHAKSDADEQNPAGQIITPERKIILAS